MLQIPPGGPLEPQILQRSPNRPGSARSWPRKLQGQLRQLADPRPCGAPVLRASGAWTGKFRIFHKFWVWHSMAVRVNEDCKGSCKLRVCRWTPDNANPHSAQHPHAAGWHQCLAHPATRVACCMPSVSPQHTTQTVFHSSLRALETSVIGKAHEIWSAGMQPLQSTSGLCMETQGTQSQLSCWTKVLRRDPSAAPELPRGCLARISGPCPSQSLIL